MCGGSSTSTQTVSVPPEVLARYNAVNTRAETTAQQPFTPYSTDPNAFVAGLSPTQQAGIYGTNVASTMAQPYYSQATNQLMGAQEAAVPFYGAAAQNVTGALQGARPYQQAATSLAAAGTQAVRPGELGGEQINKYMSPYLNTVLQSTAALQNQMNQQAMSGQTGNAIRAGAFGGDRSGVAAANLAQQQQLASSKTFADILNQGYGQALSTAQQQQGLGLSAEQANRAALQQGANQMLGIGQQGFGQGMTAAQQQAALGQGLYGIGSGTSQQLANLGMGAQTAGLQGAQAQLAAGQVQQQTEQAGRTALYNQFLQQQSYPFQVAQFLAGIAEGTGALSGSTTTTNQPGGLFSDRRLKENVAPIGKTFDGQPIYKYNYKGDDTTQIGLMAQNVEKHHPEAVGLAGGYKTVNYDKATEDAAKRGHFAAGGYASMGGGVMPEHAGQGFADGGYLDPAVYQMMLERAAQMYAPLGGLGGAQGTVTGYGRNIPMRTTSPGGIQMLPGKLEARPSDMEQLGQSTDAIVKAKGLGEDVSDWLKERKDKRVAADAGRTIDDNPDLYAAGGYATAGYVPYEKAISGPQLDIESEDPAQKALELLKAKGAPGKAPSTAGDIKDLASAAADIASIFAKRGGAIAKADGGEVDDEDNSDDSLDTDINDQMRHMGEALRSSYERNAKADGQREESEDNSSTDQGDRETPEHAALNIAGNAVSGSSGEGTEGKIAKVEGTGKNPKSSAVGKYQIIDSTFVNYFKKLHPDEAKSMSKGDILALRNSPRASSLYEEMGPAITADNKQKLRSSGLAVNDKNIYALHFLGPVYGPKVLTADANTPVDRLVPANFISSNPSVLKGKTAGQVRDWIGSKMLATGGVAGRKGYDDGGDVVDYNDPANAARLSNAIRRANLAKNFEKAGATVGDMATAGFTPEQTIVADTLAKREQEVAPTGVAAAAPMTAPASPTGVAAGPTQVTPRVSDTTPSQTATTPTGDYLNQMPYMMTPAGIAAATQNMPDYYGAGPDEKGGFFQNLLHGKGRNQTDAILSVLSGIGTAAAAPTRSPITAILAGLGAGAGTYQKMRDYEMQRAKTAQELAQRNRILGLTGTEVGLMAGQFPYNVAQSLANTGLIGAQTQRTMALITPEVQEALARAGLLKGQTMQSIAAANDIQTIPDGKGGANVLIINRATGAVKTVPIPAASGETPPPVGTPTPQGAAPQGTAPKTPTSPAPAQVATAPASTGWRPITTVDKTDIPSSYYLLGPSVLGPQRAHDAQVMAHQEDAARSATTAQLQLNQLAQQYGNMAPQGFLAPGLGANTRTQVVRAANSFLNSFGLPGVGDTSSAENMQKLTNTLGIGLTRSLGQRESGQVLNLAINSNPGIENSPMAFRRLVASMNMEAQRQKDMAEFYKNYSSQTGGILRGAREMFDRLNPPQRYAIRAVMQTVDRRDAADLVKNRNNPAVIQAFDRKYGKGVSSYFVR